MSVVAPRAVLVGLPGAGKSTIGRRLAKALETTLVDTDAVIETRTGRTIADIFATDGEAEFRRIEEQVVCEALATHDGVLSLGGGAVTTRGVRVALSGHTVVYLEMTAAEGVRRTATNTARPLLAGGDRAGTFRTLVAERAPLYRKVSTIRVNTNRRNPGAVVRHIAARLEDQPARRRRAPWRRPAPSEPAAGPAAGAIAAPAAPPTEPARTAVPLPSALSSRGRRDDH